MSNFNYEFITSDLDRLWSFKISEDGKVALIGFGDDEGQLTQFDIEKKEISQSYWTEGSYTLSIEFLSNSKAIIGTNNGFVMSIDLEKKVLLNKNKISNNSIKDLKLSDDKTLLFSITSTEILAFDINTLELMYERKLNFNPWYITTITKKNLIAIGGSTNKIELLNSKNLELIDSVICGEEHRDVSSLLYDNKNSLLVSGTESGTLNMWKISTDGFEKEKEFKIGDNIYWLQNSDEYIAFSTSNTDIILYWIEEQKLLRVPNALGEARFSLTTINDETYLLYQQKDRNLYLTNVSKGKIDFFQLTDLPYGVKFIDVTSNGDIIALTSEGIIVSNFLEKEEDNTITKYDFNSKEKNISVRDFVFNEVDEFIALQCKDESIKVISLVDSKVSSLNFSLNNIYSPEIKDFYGDNILLSSYKDVCIVNSTTSQSKEIINQDESFTSEPLANSKK
ncbi:MAG TPA: WD40 repeat domain-containing protein [Arcobacter sp.]|nr:WD40 repeat domain-containing protein [Arcobacter sp.]